MKYYKALYTMFEILKKGITRTTYEAAIPGRLHMSPESTKEKNMGEET